MLKMYFSSMKYDFVSDANILYGFFSRIPFLKKHFTEESFHQDKKGLGILGVAFRVVYEWLKAFFMVLIFFYLPTQLFSHFMAVGQSGFGRVNSYAYFTLILVCICGSIMNSLVFSASKKTYLMLHHMKVNAKYYFRGRLVYRFLLESVAFFSVYLIFGIGVVTALLLTVLIAVSRFAGETFNILVFRTTGKAFSELKGADVALMLAGLFTAYFVSYVRGYVPDAYNLVFHPAWMAVIFGASAIFIYYVWNYHGFSDIVMRMHTFEKVFEEEAEGLKDETVINDLSVKEVSEQNLRTDRYEKYEGYEYSNLLFFHRNRQAIFGHVKYRLIFVGIAFLCSFFAYLLGAAEVIGRGISYSLQVLVLIMYLMSTGNRICRMFFFQMDAKLLHYNYYREKETIFSNFKIRLKYMTLIDLVPAFALCAAYVLISLLIGKEAQFLTTFSVCVGILLLSVFFTAYHLTMYYLVQPYNDTLEIKKPFFTVMNLLMYVFCYLCLLLDEPATYITLGIGISVGILLTAAFTAVLRHGADRFRIR